MWKRTVAGMLLLAMISFGGCAGEWEQKEELPDTQQETEVLRLASEDHEGNLLGEYYALLVTTEDAEDVYRFLETHIMDAEMKDADQLVNGLLGYLADADAADYNRLSRQKNYLSEEMQEFIELMREEQNQPSVLDTRVNVTLQELLIRANKLEEHARKYPEGVTYPYTYGKYCELLSAGITGFYDGSSDVSNCYLDVDQLHMKEESIKAYTDFVAAYPDSFTADILREYVNMLAENDQLFTKAVKKFYGRLELVIKENFPVS